MSSHIVVQPTWLPTFQSEYSDADEDRGAQRSSRLGCLRANSSLAIIRRGHDKDAIHEASGIHLLQDVARPQQSALAKPDIGTYIGLRESADLLPSPTDDWNLQNTSSRNTSTCTIQPDSTPSLLLFPSSEETGSLDAIRSNREMASPPCMARGDLDGGSTTIWTGDNSVEETPESAYTGNDVMNNMQVPTKSNVIKEKFPSIVNDLSTLNVHRKSVRKPSMPTPTSPLLSRRAKCSKNKDDNTHFRIQETSRDIPLQNYQQPRTLPSKRRKKQSIAQRNNPYIPEIVE